MYMEELKNKGHKKCIFLNNIFRKNKCRGFGYGQKNGIYKTKDFVPGPGSYCSVEKSPEKSPSQAKSTFGKSVRKFAIIPNPPGEYSPNNNTIHSSLGRSFKIKGKLPEAMKYVNPNGPGTYDLPDTKCKKGPKFNNTHRKTRIND